LKKEEREEVREVLDFERDFAEFAYDQKYPLNQVGT